MTFYLSFPDEKIIAAAMKAVLPALRV